MSRSVSRRLSLGPVFAYEWIRSSRRWQGYALRSSFVLFLLVALAYVAMNTRSYPAKSNIRLMAELGEWFFQAVIGTQLTVVLLAAPAATAGAICLDKARGTLTHMLMTDLAVSEIVLGKLAARLVPVVGLVACTLPVMELLMLLGGVAPECSGAHSLSHSASPCSAVRLAGACRLLPPLLIVPAWVVIRCGAPLLGLLLLIAYLLSITAAVISLGLACAIAFKQRGRALAVTAGVIGLVSVAGPLFADLRTAGPATRDLAMGSPWSGANAMRLELAGYHSSELSFTIWALGWSLGYCICAAVLLGITIATFDRRLGRAATGRRRIAPICALPARAAPVIPQ